MFHPICRRMREPNLKTAVADSKAVEIIHGNRRWQYTKKNGVPGGCDCGEYQYLSLSTSGAPAALA